MADIFAVPYQTALDYLNAGWSPLPLMIKTKYPVPLDFTGAAGKYVDAEQAKLWLMGELIEVGRLTYTAGNIAIRLPRNVIGIDVDAYGDKAGAETLAAREKLWGVLPPTWVTSSKHAPSGIRLYRVPTGLAWPGQVGPGIEIIRFDHRYAMVYPSIHDKTGERYEWYTPKGKRANNYVPSPNELPKLPNKWVQGLTNGAAWVDRPSIELTDDDMARWLADRNSPDEPCDVVRQFVKKQQLDIRKAADDGGGHDEGRDAAWGALGDAFDGHKGVRWALGKLRPTFCESVRARRKGGEKPEREWKRFVEGGLKRVAAEGEPSTLDPCEEIAAGRATLDSGETLELNELGNAERLAAVADHRLRWVYDKNCWYVWDPENGLWANDNTLQRERWAIKAVDALRSVAERETEPVVKKAILAHWKSSQRPVGFRSTLEMLKGRPGFGVASTAFDADPRQLACGQWLVTLERNGNVKRRIITRDDHITFNTGVDWKDGKTSKEWDKFLTLFLPDIEIREWLQRIVGRSLLGDVDAERILLVLMGRSSTGKSTFGNMIMRALGSYAGPMPQSVMKMQSEDAPRPDLLAALWRRIIIAEELSAEHNLHVDQIKRITGNNPVPARAMRSDVIVEYIPHYTPWLITNEVPHIQGADDAMKRRVVVVPFTVPLAVGAELRGYGQDLFASSSEAILAWCIDGYRKYVDSSVPLQQIPTAAQDANAEFHRGVSDFAEFVAQCLEKGDEYFERPRAFYTAYTDWSIESGTKPMNETAFGRRMTGMGIERGRRNIDKQRVDVRVGARILRGGSSVG
jgi:P4 family phage/plasmid primase-like protien